MADLKRFFERDSVRPCSSRELLEFKHACTPEEYDAYVAEAKKQNAAFAA
jgi:hypothetical protein